MRTLSNAEIRRRRESNWLVIPPAPPREFWMTDTLRPLHDKMQAWARAGRTRSHYLSDDEFVQYHRERGLRDLFFFAKYVCAMGAGPDGSRLEAPLHANLAWAWQRPNGESEGGIEYGKERMALMPRGHLKTTLLTQAMALWLLCRNPEERILIYTSNATLGALMLAPIRLVLQGQGTHGKLFLACFGHLVPEKKEKEKWAEDMINVRRTGTYTDPSIRASGVGSTLTGGHYTWQLVDDIVGDELSRPLMEKVIRAYDNLTPMYSSLREGQRRICGTRWAFFDPYAKIERSNADALVALRTWCEKEGKPSKEYVEANLIFTHCDVDAALQLKRDNPFFFSCQYENNPRDEEKLGFKRQWFRYARREGDYLVDVDADGKAERKFPLASCNLFILIDPNTGRQPGTRTQDGNVRRKVDYVGIIVLAVSADNVWYVVRAYRKRWSVDRFVSETFALVDIWRPRWVAIETRAQQVLFLNIFQTMFKQGHPPFILIEWQGGNDTKEERIKSLQPRFANGMIRFVEGTVETNEGVNALEEELLDFPNAEFDDISDALSAGMQPEVVFAPGYVPVRDLRTSTKVQSDLDKLDAGSARAWRATLRRGQEAQGLGLGNWFMGDRADGGGPL